MSAMSEMSKAIRETMQRYAPTMSELPSAALGEFTQIVGAFYGDLQDEVRRRQSALHGVSMAEAAEAARKFAQTGVRIFPDPQDRIDDLEDALQEIYWSTSVDEQTETIIMGVLTPAQRIAWARAHRVVSDPEP